MRRVPVILLALLLMVGLAILAHAQDTQNPPLIPPDQTILADMFARINVLRERRGLAPYRLNDGLNRAAQDQAEYLASTGRRGHFRPDGSRPSTRAAAFGFVSSHWCCGENYYMSIDATPDMVYDFWRWSPSHVINMVHGDFTDVGLGMSSDGYRISYVTIFGEADDLHLAQQGVVQAQPIVDQQAQPAPETSAGAPQIAAASGEYIVLPGDTLGRIAARFHTSVRTLMTLNRIVNPEIIYPGQHLALPAGTAESQPQAAPPQSTATAPQTTQSHVVIVGETLAQIAARYGTNVQAVAAANNIANPSLIYAGQVLNIPAGS